MVEYHHHHWYGPGGGNEVGVTGAIAGVLGFFGGGYYGWINHGSWGDIAGGATSSVGLITFGLFSIAADWLQSFAPHSDAMAVVVFVVKWIVGGAYTLCAAVGGFMGGTLAWFAWDISHHLN
jgi:hypothetical protein